ncbi:uncharacterized protein LOC143297623 [Babylonia areolata]|uniref:uncharacterized protein LOC143297623 n=1 Tax=Babylonia areolata TaxID=304850 RepID=UPI003FD513CB
MTAVRDSMGLLMAVLCAVTYAQNLALKKECKSDVTQCPGEEMAQFPVCGDCASFLKCAGRARSARFTCTSGLHYDVTLGVCQWSDLASTACKPATASSTTTTVPSTPSTTPPTTTTNTTPTTTTVLPTTSTATTTTPPTVTTTTTTTTTPTTTTTTTTPPTTITTTPPTTTKTTTAPTTTTTITTTTAKTSSAAAIPGCVTRCEGHPGSDLFYPSCTGCSYFFFCVNLPQSMGEVKCEGGWEWDDNEKRCVPPPSTTCSAGP